MVILTLMLYTAFAFNPIASIPIFSRTLNLSPGDVLTVLLVFGIVIKALLQNPNNIVFGRPPAVIHFLCSYIFLAVVFFCPTLLFFVLHNEQLRYLPRSIFHYLQWIIALVLFYYGSDSRLNAKELRLIVWILMIAFFTGVMINIFIVTSGVDLFNLITLTLASKETRLGGQISDPNQLGALAAFFTIVGIMGALHEQQKGPKIAFLMLSFATVIVLLLTQSREALLTLFVAVLCIMLLLMRGKQYFKAFIIWLGLILGSSAIVMNVPRIIETISAIGIGDTKYSLSNREEVWRTAVEIISKYPFGVGFENMEHLTVTVNQAHNAFLQSAVVAGFLGFIAFAGFLIFLFNLLWVQRKLVSQNWMLDAYFVFIIGYLATAMGSDHFIAFYTFNAIFFGLLGFVVCMQ